VTISVFDYLIYKIFKNYNKQKSNLYHSIEIKVSLQVSTNKIQDNPTLPYLQIFKYFSYLSCWEKNIFLLLSRWTINHYRSLFFLIFYKNDGQKIQVIFGTSKRLSIASIFCMNMKWIIRLLYSFDALKKSTLFIFLDHPNPHVTRLI
jgi:hypothetical protein